MSAGKIILLIFGVIVLLISFGLIACGGTLLWAEAKYVDSEGFLTSDALSIERDSLRSPPMPRVGLQEYYGCLY